MITSRLKHTCQNRCRMTNGLLEGYNSVLRAGRGIARGFRTSANVILKSLLFAEKTISANKNKVILFYPKDF